MRSEPGFALGRQQHEPRDADVTAPSGLPAPAAAGTRLLHPAQVLALQRTAGNAAVQRALVLRDIKPGDALPDLDQELVTRVGAGVGDAASQGVGDDVLLAKAKSELGGIDVSLGFLGQMKGPFRPEETAAAKRDIQAAVRDATAYAAALTVAQAAADLEDIGTSAARQAAGPQFKSTRQLVDAWFATVNELAGTERREDRIAAETTRLKARKATKELDPATKKQFSAALKNMSFVQLILKNPKRDPTDAQQSGSGVVKAGWKGGGNLQDVIVEETANQPKSKQFRDDIDSGKFRRRVEEADRFLKLLVEPEVLADIPCPSIVVHTKHSEFAFFSPTSWVESNVFRAYQSGAEIHVAQNDETAIIVHEVGHYLEKKLPIEAWTDIRALIQQRHAAAGGGAAAEKGRGSSKEGGFAGSYPATGKYTSRAYSSGDTEVMSLTVEYLKRPGDTLDMIEKDPVQAAIVLRHLRPKDYAATAGLDAFDEYIPTAPAAAPVLS